MSDPDRIADRNLVKEGYCRCLFKFICKFSKSPLYRTVVQTLIVGLGVFIYADHMLFSGVFKIFGGALIATSLLLMMLPWKWHNKLGKWAIPILNKHIIVYAVSVSLLGLAILYCVLVPAL